MTEFFEISENQPWSYDFYFDDPDMELAAQNGAKPLVSITDAVSFQYSLNELNKVTLVISDCQTTNHDIVEVTIRITITFPGDSGCGGWV